MDVGEERAAQARNYALKLLDKITLKYHNKDHTLDVYNRVEWLCASENIDGKEKELLSIGALYHDTGFIRQYKNNEPIGAEIAANALAEFNYSQEDIEIVKNIILATALPQNPKTKLEEIICDADLGVFGRDDFFALNDALRQELNIDDRLIWYKGQLKFLEDHTYFTNTAKRELGPIKKKHIEEMRAKIKELENG